jgi:hypothetical protein
MGTLRVHFDQLMMSIAYRAEQLDRLCDILGRDRIVLVVINAFQRFNQLFHCDSAQYRAERCTIQVQS